MNRPSPAPAKSALRSRVTNRSAVLTGVDGRSAMARRYRDLVDALADQMGGDPGEVEMLQIRAAATLHLHVEELTARIARGEAVSSEELTRAANGAMRATTALTALRPRKAGRPATPQTVVDYLAAKRAGGEAAA